MYCSYSNPSSSASDAHRGGPWGNYYFGQGVLPTHLWDDPLGERLRLPYDVSKVSVERSGRFLRCLPRGGGRDVHAEGMPLMRQDPYTEKDTFGTFVSCVQCGFNKDVATEGVGQPQTQHHDRFNSG